MGKASPKAHHESLALQPSPQTPDELQAMLDELIDLYNEMRAKPGEQSKTAVTPPGAVPVVRAVQRNR